MPLDAGSESPVPIRPTVVRWEYVTDVIDVQGFFSSGNVDPREINDQLNRRGVEGWELASTFDTAGRQGGTKTVVLIFKRPRSH